MSLRNRFAPTLVGLSLVMLSLAVGCQPTSLSQIGAFGNAASSLADGAQKGFELIDSSTVLRNVYDRASDSTKGPTPHIFEGVFSIPPATTRPDAPLPVAIPPGKPDPKRAEDLKARLKLLSNLGSYADALHSLATANFQKDIDSAATDLDGALKGLRDDYGKVSGKAAKISDQDLQIIATAVDAIGAVIVDEKRREAIKTIVEKANPAVQDVATLLENYFSDKSDDGVSFYVKENLKNAVGSLEQAYNTERLLPDSTFYKRYQMLLDLQNMYQIQTSSPQFFSDIVSGAQTMAKTHQAIFDAVEKNQFNSAEIADGAGALSQYAQSVQKFYNSLNPTKK